MNREKEIIYSLMRELVIERRELSKQYYELKYRLDQIDSSCTENITRQVHMKKRNIKNVNGNVGMKTFSCKRGPKLPLERLAGYIVEVLKDSGIPLSGKKIHKYLEIKYEIFLNYSNLSSNILPKLAENHKYPINKPYRGFWQYKRECDSNVN